jgi:hypothetical protein
MGRVVGPTIFFILFNSFIILIHGNCRYLDDVGWKFGGLLVKFRWHVAYAN